MKNSKISMIFILLSITIIDARITRKYTQDANTFLKRPLKILEQKLMQKYHFEIYLLNDWIIKDHISYYLNYKNLKEVYKAIKYKVIRDSSSC